MPPAFSIIMNCYNGSKYLKNALCSIEKQTFTDYEVIFFDNASTDNSGEIAQQFGSKLTYIKRNQNVPLGQARKEALEHCKGIWIAFLDCDDEWMPDKLKIQFEGVSKYPDIALCYAGVEEINEQEKVLRTLPCKAFCGDYFAQLLVHFDINMVTPIVRRHFLIKYDLNFDSRIFASEEYNLFMKIAALGNILILPQVLGKYRVCSDSLTFKSIEKWYFERKITLDDVNALAPEKCDMHQIEFNIAKDRGVYYLAVYKASINDFSNARKELRKIAFQNKIYLILYIVSYMPILWKFVHNVKIRRYLLKTLKHIGMSK